MTKQNTEPLVLVIEKLFVVFTYEVFLPRAVYNVDTQHIRGRHASQLFSNNADRPLALVQEPHCCCLLLDLRLINKPAFDYKQLVSNRPEYARVRTLQV